MTDEQWMRRALALAERGRYSTSPNPMVGCVIVRNEVVIGEGFHLRAGLAHAEREALAACSDMAAGATMYVTLEPCSHTGRTPPCVDAVIGSGVGRVVIAMIDPNPLVNGRSVERLRAAGIETVVGVCEDEARRLNERFVTNSVAKRPFVLLKAGMSLDGKLATITRKSQWITGDDSRQRSLLLREEYDAILVGSGTVAADDPQLTRRLGLASGLTPWTRVIIDTSDALRPEARVLSDGGRTIVFTSNPERLARTGAEIVKLTSDREAHLSFVLAALYERGITSVVAEGGSVLHTSLIRQKVWDKMMLFVAPLVIGGDAEMSIFGGGGVTELVDAYRLRFDSVERVGPDLLITAYPA